MKSKVPIILIVLMLLNIISRGQWQYVKGGSYDPILPKYGILNQSHIYNSTGYRQGSATWSYNNEIYLFGGSGNYTTGSFGSYNYNGGVYNDIWKFNPANNQWTWIKGSRQPDDPGIAGTLGLESPTAYPSARKNFTYWVVDNYVYVYNGDFWKYNMQTNNWTCISVAPAISGPVYGQLNVPSATAYPGKRSRASCWTQGNYLYLFGGYTESHGDRNDVWRYDLTTNLWVWLKGTSIPNSFGEVWGTPGLEEATTTPGARTGMVSEVLGDMVYVYGAYNQVWRYNMVSNNWCVKYGIQTGYVTSTDSLLINPSYGTQNVYAATNSPGIRTDIQGWSKDGTILLFGGTTAYNTTSASYNHLHNDIWQFDTTLSQWRLVSGSSAMNQRGKYGHVNVEVPANSPGGRMNMLLWKSGNNIFIANGFGFSSNGSARLISDTWKYNAVTNNWTWMAGSDNSSLSYVSSGLNTEDDGNRPVAGKYQAFWNADTAIYVMGQAGSQFIGNTPGGNPGAASADAIWKYNSLTNNWSMLRRNTSESILVLPVYGVINIADSLNTPGKRMFEATWQVGSKLYLMGGQRYSSDFVLGQGTDSMMNDLWEFDLNTKNWKWIKGSNTYNAFGVYGTLGTAAAGNTPGARSEALTWAKNGKLYLLGGWGRAETGQVGLLNDLWEFDPATGNWRWIHGTKIRNQLTTFGTQGVANANNKPGGRYGAVCWTLGNKLYTFTGRGTDAENFLGSVQYLHELWSYDITTNAWTWLKGNNSTVQYSIDNFASYGNKGVETATVRPPATIGSTGSVNNGKLILYGGYGYGQCSSCGGTNNNLWSYNPQNNNWTWLEGSGDGDASNRFPDTPVAQSTPILPSEWKGCTYAVSWSYNNRFYTFGGEGYVTNNDIWGYKLCTLNPAACDTVAPVANLGPDTAICPGNYVELHSGTFGYLHLWNTGDTTQNIIVTQSGTYWIKVTNPANGIFATDTIVVQSGSAVPAVSIASSMGSSICSGNPVTFQASPTNGGNAPAYLWKVNGTPVGTSQPTYSSNTFANGDIVTCELISSLNCASPAGATSNAVTLSVAPAVLLSASITSSTGNICSGTNVTFTAVITNGGNAPSYQWKKNAANVGTNSITYNDNALSSADVITCVVSGSECSAGSTTMSNSISTAVTTSVTPTISIATASNTICAGQNVSFTATAVNGGTTPTYQWKVNNINTGTNTATFSTNTLTSGAVVSCVLTSNNACVTTATASSNNINVTVNAAVNPTVTISNPVTTICQGTPATFTATATNTGTTPSYQWKVNGSNAGSNSTTFTTAALNNNDVVTCTLTSSANCALTTTANSNGITMTVNPSATPTLSIVASANPVCSGTAMQFSATATLTGTTPVYQWKVNNTPTGSNSPAFSSSTLNSGDDILCVLTSNATGCLTATTATSNSITAVVNPMVSPGITISTANGPTVCQGSPVTFTANTTNAGGSPVYQWKKNNINVGTSLNTYTDAGLLNGDIISCDVTGSAACMLTPGAYSNAITMTILPTVTPAVSISSTQTSVCSNTNVTFTATPVNGGTAPVYQWKKNGSNVGTNSNTYTDALLANGDIIRCELTSNATCAAPAAVLSNMVTMTVAPQLTPSITITTPNDQLCDNNPSATFSAAVLYEGTSPVYQWRLNGANTGTNSNTYTNAAVVNGDVVTCQLNSNATCLTVSSVISNAVSLMVHPVYTANIVDSVCEGETYTFGTQTLNAPGNYTGIWTTSYGCDSTLHLSLSVVPTITPSISISANPGSAVTSGQSVIFTASIQHGGTAPVITWKKNNSPVAGAGGTTWQSVAGTDFAAGDQISAMLLSNAPCTSTPEAQSGLITMSIQSVGIKDQEKPEMVQLFPNPTLGLVTVKGLIHAGTVVLFDALGRKIFRKTYLANVNLYLSLARYATGAYTLLFTDEKGKQWSFKIIRE